MLAHFFIALAIYVATVESEQNSDAGKFAEVPLWSPRCSPVKRRSILRLVPNPWNCRSMFICDKGTPIEYYCPKGQIFHPERQECVEKSLYSCHLNLKDWSPFAECFEDYQKKQFFKHPVDCRKFYHCGPSGAVLKKCQSGLFWDDVKVTCNWEKDVDCKSKYLIPVDPIKSDNFMNNEVDDDYE